MFKSFKIIRKKNSYLSSIILYLIYIEKRYDLFILRILRMYFWQIILNSQIPPSCFSSDYSVLTLRIVHPYLIIIHPQSKIGDNCTIYHGVTLGCIEHKSQEAPVIGNNVYIGCKATILGGGKNR